MPACPGWKVRDVVAHLAGPAEDAVASHEQDIRGAVGRPGARDSEVIRACTAGLLEWLDVPAPIKVLTEDGEFLAGPAADGAGSSLVLTLATSRFEAFRWRMGRRSRAQLAAMSWSGDPEPVIGHLTVFRPASVSIIE